MREGRMYLHIMACICFLSTFAASLAGAGQQSVNADARSTTQQFLAGWSSADSNVIRPLLDADIEFVFADSRRVRGVSKVLGHVPTTKVSVTPKISSVDVLSPDSAIVHLAPNWK